MRPPWFLFSPPPPLHLLQKLTESNGRVQALAARLDAQSRAALSAASRSHADELARLLALTTLPRAPPWPRPRGSASAGGSPAAGSPPHDGGVLPLRHHRLGIGNGNGGGGSGDDSSRGHGGSSGGGSGRRQQQLPPAASPLSSSSRSSGGERRLILNGTRLGSPPPASPPSSPSSDWGGAAAERPPLTAPLQPLLQPPLPPRRGRDTGTGGNEGGDVASALLWGDAPLPGVARRRLSSGPGRSGGLLRGR